jgi:folate/biopterin transporter
MARSRIAGAKDDVEANDTEENTCSETAPLLIDKKLCIAGDKLSDGKDHVDDLCAKCFPWLADLRQAFGFKLLAMLFASQHLMKGFVSSLIGPATQFLFGSYNVAGPRMQIFSGIVMLPWAMKPIIGLISDCFPIYGYNKGPYVFGACLLGAFSLGLVAKSQFGIEVIVILLFFIQLQASTCDLLTEAKYAEKMQSNPEKGPDLMTYVWFGLQGGGFVATLMAGPMMDHYGARAPFLVAVLPASFILIPLARNYMEEVPQSPQQVLEARKKMFEQKEACFLCLLMFVGTIVLTVLGIAFQNVLVNAVAAITVAVVMLIAFSVTLRPLIAKVNAFFLLQTSLGFSIGGATFYFYTDSADKYKDGPHFSMEFYTSVLGVAGTLCSLVGIYTYQRYMREWKYRDLLLMTNVVLSVLSVADVIMLSRLNVRWGIPDHVFVLGASVFQQIIGQWMWMPGVVIMSQLCPKGMEATMYALLAGCHNLGNTIASNCGALVLQWLGCAPSGRLNEDAEFTNLWRGAALSIVLPMLTLFLLPYMIPDARQTDKLLAEDDRDATTGSLWKRWTGAGQ